MAATLCSPGLWVPANARAREDGLACPSPQVMRCQRCRVANANAVAVAVGRVRANAGGGEVGFGTGEAGAACVKKLCLT